MHALLALLTIATVSAELISADRLPLRTSGSRIVDAQGRRAKLACVNWYGAHMEQHAVSGLHVQPLAAITSTIVSMGFNCIRLPFSLQLWSDDPVVPASVLQANPELQGLTGMQLLDRVIEEFRERQLLVILSRW